MKKENILLIGLPILCVIAAIIAYFTLDTKNIESDAIKFKNEYEDYNGVEVGNYKYSILEISKNNPMKYSTYDELVDVIKNGTGIIYLGFPECPWCRSALPVLLEAAKDNDIDIIYYLNIKNERDSYVVQDGKVVYEIDDKGNEKKGTEGYFKLLEALDDHLSEYTLSLDDKIYKTGEKRIYAPTVIFVKDGKILDLHVSTIDSQESGFDKLTEEQAKELYDIYEEYILDMKKATCSIGSSC